MRMTKRLEALEAAVIKAQGPEAMEVIHVIIAPDRSVVGAYRHNSDGMIEITGDELEDIKRKN